MAKIDLKPLSLTELKALKTRVEKAIANHDKKKKAKALAALKAKAKELGFSLSDLTGGNGAKAKSTKPVVRKPKVAYRDTADAKNVWSGRGPRPKWLRAALESGKKLEDFKV